MHSFSSATQFSEQLLVFSGDAALEDRRFHARNFRHERAIAPARAASYLAGDIDLGPGTHDEQFLHWNEHHDRYLKQHVRAGWRGDPFDGASASAPETFRVRTNLDEYGYIDDTVDLVRIEDLTDIAAITGQRLDDLLVLADIVALERRTTGRAASGATGELDDLLQVWQEPPRFDNRPTFAGFWEDAFEGLPIQSTAGPTTCETASD